MKKNKRAILDPRVGMQDRTLHFLYETTIGRQLLNILISPWVSRMGGYLMSSRLSSLFVKPFIKSHEIDLSSCQNQSFESFNDFFTRKLKKDARPVDMDSQSVISPCDSALSVYPISDKSLFRIKNSIYTLKQLIQNDSLAERYQGGQMWLYRLSVEDYHRYIYPVSGRKSEQLYIDGVFHTVNPIANEHFLIYKENSREYCLIRTEENGTILMMEVGAMMVGKVENRIPESANVCRGEEKGNFAFGGSTIIVLTQKGQAHPLEKIIQNSQKGIETKVKLGEKVGTVKAKIVEN